jgi:hypothetical protein
MEFLSKIEALFETHVYDSASMFLALENFGITGSNLTYNMDVGGSFITAYLMFFFGMD